MHNNSFMSVLTQRRPGIARLAAVAMALLAQLVPPAVSTVAAQTAEKVHRIAYLRGEKPPDDDIAGFREGLREQGYVEGRNLVLDIRWGDGDEAKLRSMVGEVVALMPDVIVTSAPAATQAAKDITRAVASAAGRDVRPIPVVMVHVADPVGFGIVGSYARPGGNVTGFAFALPEISGKRLELLKEVIPGLTRVAVLWNASNAYKEDDLKEVLKAARPLKVAVLRVPVKGADDIERALAAAMKSRPGGLVTLEDPFTIANARRIAEAVARHNLPAVYAARPFVDAGGLMYYAPDRRDQVRRAGAVVDRILRGARPEDIPVERPRKFELVINAKAAATLGVAIPQSVQLRADRVMP